MGTIHHHAIVVTSFDEKMAAAARHKAIGLGLCATECHQSEVNCYFSFAVLPDGSKEYWAESDSGDEKRAALIKWMDGCAYEDGSNVLQWVEVSFGDLPATIATNQEPPK